MARELAIRPDGQIALDEHGAPIWIEAPVVPKIEEEKMALDLQKLNAKLADEIPLPGFSPRAGATAKMLPEAGIILYGPEGGGGTVIALKPDKVALRLIQHTERSPFFATGGVFEGKAARSLTKKEFEEIYVRAAASVSQDVGFNHGFLHLWVDRDQAEMCDEIPDMLAKLNEEVKKVEAEILYATPAQIVHGTNNLGSAGGEDPVPYKHVDGNRATACYAGPGYVVQAKLEGVMIPGPLAMTPDGLFIGSPWCQRVAPNFGTHRQFNVLENKCSLLEWLAGPAAVKFLPKNKLVALNKTPKREIDPAVEQLSKGFCEIREAEVNRQGGQWLLPDETFKAKVKEMSDADKHPFIYHYQNGTFWLMPVGQRGAFQFKKAVPAFGRKGGFLEDYAQKECIGPIDKNVLLIEGTIAVRAYYAFCSTMLNMLRGKKEGEVEE